MEKKDIAIYMRKLTGLNVSFYNDADVAMFKGVLEGYNVADKLEYDEGCLYTTHPSLHLPINQVPTRPADTYGIIRFDLYTTLVRPHIANVVSCHRFEPDFRSAGGNLNYLANPHWATYGIYINPNRKATFEFEVVDEQYSLDIPPILSTVNVCFMMDKDRKLCAYFSRIYGEPNMDGIIKLMEYFEYVMGISVYISTRWSSLYYREELVGFQFSTEEETLLGIPFTPQIYMPNTNKGDKALVYRYPDIADVQMHNIAGEIQYYEKLTAYKCTPPYYNSPRYVDVAENIVKTLLDKEDCFAPFERLMGPALNCCANCNMVGDMGDELENRTIMQVDGTTHLELLCYRCIESLYKWSTKHGEVLIPKEHAVLICSSRNSNDYIFLHELDPQKYMLNTLIPALMPFKGNQEPVYIEKVKTVTHTFLSVRQGILVAENKVYSSPIINYGSVNVNLNAVRIYLDSAQRNMLGFKFEVVVCRISDMALIFDALLEKGIELHTKVDGLGYTKIVGKTLDRTEVATV